MCIRDRSPGYVSAVQHEIPASHVGQPGKDKQRQQNAKATVQLNEIRGKLATVQDQIAAAQQTKSRLERETQHLYKKCAEDEELCDKASAMALEMRDELAAMVAKRELLEDEHVELALENERLKKTAGV
eukprot:TRINITY_DN4452_c0_g1_i1.p1 TRINITY_DN4452_c0_g1~~TRINITY_DN4452_c0_g1_i1.p1  ORF type:complete len:129 (+),score=38.33 TRINITY_DN4452_c0_g1_i1:158-544(+)